VLRHAFRGDEEWFARHNHGSFRQTVCADEAFPGIAAAYEDTLRVGDIRYHNLLVNRDTSHVNILPRSDDEAMKAERYFCDSLTGG